MRRTRFAILLAALGVGSLVTAGFAPAPSATIRPGVQTVASGQCTANFVFSSGEELFLGQAAHCTGSGAATNVNGCMSASRPLGTPVQIEGAAHPGELVYSSWLAMQRVGETDPLTCRYNDFALVRIDPRDRARVNPSVPVFGGPRGVDTDGAPAGSLVYSFGSSELRLSLSALSPKVGTSLGSSGGWATTVLAVTPGIPGDSGSAVLSQNGQALGILTTLTLAPIPGANEVTSLDKALRYANAHSMLGPFALVDGTTTFTGSPLSLVDGLVGGLLNDLSGGGLLN